MRRLENDLLKESTLNTNAQVAIDEYENSMLRNKYSVCESTQLETGIFMGGVAHGQSIISKIADFNIKNNVKLNCQV